MNTADYLPEAVGYGRPVATVWPPGTHSRVGPAGNGYPASYGYDGAAAEPGWAADQEGLPWQEWQDWQNWQDWGPPPAMHPDHPSAPVPRIEFPADHPSGPLPAARARNAPELPQRRPGGSDRTWNPSAQIPDDGYGNRSRRLYAVPDDASAADRARTAPRTPEGRQFPGQRAADPAGADWQEPTDFYREPGPARREAVGYQPQTSPGWQEPTGYRRETGPLEPRPGPAPGRFKDFRSPKRDSLRATGQVLEVHHGQDRASDRVALADDRVAQIAQEARHYAAAIREAAERDAAAITKQASDRADAITQEAATRADVITQQASGQATAIREAMEREAAELRARLDSMTGELSRVAAYVTQNLAPSPTPASVPALPDAMPALPATSPVLPDTRPGTSPGAKPARPGTSPGAKPARPGTSPGAKPARPATKPGTGPTRPATSPGARPVSPARTKTTPAKPSATPTKLPQTQGRQRQAMRIATAGTAALLSIAAVGAVTYTSIHGFSFFVFRESGQGETPGNFTDAKFLARQAAAQLHDSAPKGRHHKAAGSQ